MLRFVFSFSDKSCSSFCRRDELLRFQPPTQYWSVSWERLQHRKTLMFCDIFSARRRSWEESLLLLEHQCSTRVRRNTSVATLKVQSFQVRRHVCSYHHNTGLTIWFHKLRKCSKWNRSAEPNVMCTCCNSLQVWLTIEGTVLERLLSLDSTKNKIGVKYRQTAAKCKQTYRREKSFAIMQSLVDMKEFIYYFLRCTVNKIKYKDGHTNVAYNEEKL